MAKNTILSNLCSAIRNGQKARTLEIKVRKTRKTLGIVEVLKKEGFIRGYRVENFFLFIFLKYYQDKPVISIIEPILSSNNSKTVSSKQLKKQGLDTYILSTSKGIVSNFESSLINEGGQLLIRIL